MAYENQLARAKQQLKDLQTELKTCETTFKRVKEERDSYKTKIEENEQVLVTVSKDLEKASFWVEAFGPRGIRSFIFENALPYLSEKANTYSTILTGGTVTIDILPTTPLKNGTTKEKLFVSAKNSFGANVYAGNSDGERRRIDICILLALQDLIASRASKVWNTIIFDEVMDTLDKTGIQNVIELLRTYQNKNIFLISHSEDLKQYFDTAIIVQKENGVSKLL
jgi:DNA repair exonuclease SbcCD ATPase subunit